jgi:hypothetical protein
MSDWKDKLSKVANGISSKDKLYKLAQSYANTCVNGCTCEPLKLRFFYPPTIRTSYEYNNNAGKLLKLPLVQMRQDILLGDFLCLICSTRERDNEIHQRIKTGVCDFAEQFLYVESKKKEIGKCQFCMIKFKENDPMGLYTWIINKPEKDWIGIYELIQNKALISDINTAISKCILVCETCKYRKTNQNRGRKTRTTQSKTKKIKKLQEIIDNPIDGIPLVLQTITSKAKLYSAARKLAGKCANGC